MLTNALIKKVKSLDIIKLPICGGDFVEIHAHAGSYKSGNFISFGGIQKQQTRRYSNRLLVDSSVHTTCTLSCEAIIHCDVKSQSW